MASATPKQFAVDGVVYVRTTNGNLVRATLVKNKLLAKRAAKEELKKKCAKAAPKRSFCKFYTRFACSHFQRNSCTKDDCVYPHIRINPQAQICRPFATEGWCDAGSNCKDRHVWVCPDFGTTVGCKKRCGLAHLANGGIRVKKSAEEVEKEKQNGSEFVNNTKRKRVESTLARRYMDGQRQPDQDSDQHQEQSMDGFKDDRDFDENFIPLDLGDDFDEEFAMLLDQQDDIQESEGHVQDKEEQVDDDEGDISSEGVESDDEVSAADVASEEEGDPEDEDDDESDGHDQDELEDYENQYEDDEY
ncbi:hypothetical protein EC968_003004 [Mortierella alpina]|nr:hypothetical protein EC968_003004 [Mortierella alpina]